MVFFLSLLSAVSNTRPGQNQENPPPSRYAIPCLLPIAPGTAAFSPVHHWAGGKPAALALHASRWLPTGSAEQKRRRIGSDGRRLGRCARAVPSGQGIISSIALRKRKAYQETARLDPRSARVRLWVSRFPCMNRGARGAGMLCGRCNWIAAWICWASCCGWKES